MSQIPTVRGAPALTDSSTVHLRIVVLRPPSGVRWALQLGRDELVSPVEATDRHLVFETSARVVAGTSPAFRGPAVQGPRGKRFIYVNSGTRAGQSASRWDRRAKVSLEGIGASIIAGAAGSADVRLVVSFEGTAADGGPACATVPLLGAGWGIESRTD
ncbi:MAG: DUF5990 family protein [Streptosporangiaceae bacterium]